MITILFILLLIVDFLWIGINWYERITDPYAGGNLCILETLFLAFGIWWMIL